MSDDFTAAAARRIVGISQRCLDYWDERSVVKPSSVRACGKGTERRYTYDDLLKLTVVKRLRASGLSLQRIRKGLSKLRKTSQSDDPLLREMLVTDGKSLHRITENITIVEDLLADGQLVFSIVAVGRIDTELRAKVLRLKDATPRRGRKKAVVRRTAR